MKYLSLFSVYCNIAYQVYVVNRRFTKRMFGELTKKGVIKESLDESLKRRIFFYTAQCYISAIWTCTLRGKKMSEAEKKRVIYLGVITPIVDDLTDEEKLTSTEILKKLKQPFDISENVNWSLAKYLYAQLSKDCPSGFLETFEAALISQDVSLKQLEAKKLSTETLKEISKSKGGSFVILYRVVIDPPLKPGEKEALTTLGYILQQINDMFDVYKDYKNGQQTLFTNSNDIRINYGDFQEQLNHFVHQMYKLDFEQSRIHKCLIEISTITSRGFVCLDQLIALQKGEVFSPEKYSRKQLICDMEKVTNMIKSFRYSLAFYKR